jgi:hypothetical protein
MSMAIKINDYVHDYPDVSSSYAPLLLLFREICKIWNYKTHLVN